MSMMLAKRQEILAIGWMADGSPIFPIWGCDPEDPEGGTGVVAPPAGTDPSGGVDPAAGDPAAPGVNPEELARQLETLTRRLAAADTAKGQAEKALRAYEDQGKSDLERAQGQVKELTEKLAQQQEAAVRAKLEREVLKHPGYIWHDPDTVLALIDLTGVEFDDETGKVTGVNDALKKLAASKPFLLKGRNADGGGQGNAQGNAGQKLGSSGTNTGNASPDEQSKKRAGLVAKYKL